MPVGLAAGDEDVDPVGLEDRDELVGRRVPVARERLDPRLDLLVDQVEHHVVPVAALRDPGVLVDPEGELLLRVEALLDELSGDDRVENEGAAHPRLEPADHRLQLLLPVRAQVFGPDAAPDVRHRDRALVPAVAVLQVIRLQGLASSFSANVMQL